MTIMKVEGMHCGKCVERIQKAFEKAELMFQISLEEKQVEIDGCEHCVKTALELLEELGFDGEIVG